MKRLIALLLVLPTFLSSTCFAADPRKMLKAQKAYFSSMEEDRASLRRVQDIQRLEDSKLAMLEQKNAISDLIAQNGSPTVSVSGGKTTEPGLTDPPPSEHADYDDVRQFAPVLADAPPTRTMDLTTLNKAASFLLSTDYEVLDDRGSLIEEMERISTERFLNIGRGLCASLHMSNIYNFNSGGQDFITHLETSYGTVEYSGTIIGYKDWNYTATFKDKRSGSVSIAGNMMQNTYSVTDFRFSFAAGSSALDHFYPRTSVPPTYLYDISQISGYEVVRTRWTGEDTIWSIYDGSTEVLRLEVDNTASENLLLWGMPFPAQVTEYFQQGNAVRVEILAPTLGDSVIYRPLEGTSHIVYNSTGQLVWGDIVDPLYELIGGGYRISMKAGHVDQVSLWDPSLYELPSDSDSGYVADGPIFKFKGIDRMSKDARAYGPIFEQDLFDKDRDKLLELAGNSNLEGILANPYRDMTTVYEIDEFATTTHWIEGTYYQDHGNTPSIADEYTSSRIIFTPFPTSNEISFIPTNQYGEVSKERAFLSSTIQGTSVKHGSFKMAIGDVEKIETHSDLYGGTFLRSDLVEDLGGYLNSRFFSEQDQDGFLWAGFRFEYIGEKGGYFSDEHKFRLMLSEEDEEGVEQGAAKYDFSQLMLGFLLGQEHLALSSARMERLKDFVVNQITTMINSAYASASRSTQQLIDSFNEKAAPKLDAFIHYQVHAVPAVARHVVAERASLGSIVLSRQIRGAYNFSQLLASVDPRYAAQIIQNFFKIP